MTPAVLRYSAFTTDPSGGNPAGIVLDARGLSDDAMRRIAADVGYSETAFLLPRADGELDVRYFSPLAEVSFCGHATIAAMVAHARRQGPGDFVLHTQAGRVRVTVDVDHGVGLEMLARIGDRVTRGQPLARIIHRGGRGLDDCRRRLGKAFTIADNDTPAPELIWERM